MWTGVGSGRVRARQSPREGGHDVTGHPSGRCKEPGAARMVDRIRCRPTQILPMNAAGNEGDIDSGTGCAGDVMLKRVADREHTPRSQAEPLQAAAIDARLGLAVIANPPAKPGIAPGDKSGRLMQRAVG